MNNLSTQDIATKVALVGVGGHGSQHLRMLDALANENPLQLVAVADPYEDRMPEVAGKLRASGVDWFADYQKMLRAHPDVDLLVICTPIHLHEEMTLAALRETSARILLEKPAVPSLAQLESLIAADSSRRVRVGFHMMHWPQVEMLRRWVADGELGSIQSITASAGWPRGDQYYSRAPWAGRMEMAGSLVYDGPATNALSHLLNNICFFMGQENQFAHPSAVSGWLARARSIKSYDTFFSECQIGGADVRVFLTHAVSEKVPFEIRVTGERATAWLCETQPVLRRSDLEEVELPPLAAVKFPMYRRMVGAEGDFDGMPGTLEDMRGYTEWTEMMRLAGPVREIDPSLCFKNEEGVIAMRGMEAILHEFAKSGREVPIFGT